MNDIFEMTCTVDALRLRLPEEVYDDLADNLEISNGSSHSWSREHQHFKHKDIVNKALDDAGVPQDATIYLKFSW